MFFAPLAGSATNGVPTPGSADGTGTAASFNQPLGAAIDSAGNIYVSDADNGTIRKVTPAGVVTTLAGLAGSFGNVDGTGSAARFTRPAGIVADASGNLYVADTGQNVIRKVTPAGVVTTFAGLANTPGSTDGVGSSARFRVPEGLALDASGNLYVSDRNNHTIRKVTPAGVVTTLAGLAGTSGSSDGTGAGARFNRPLGLAVDRAGNVYVSEPDNRLIRKITPSGVVSTLAGLAGSGGIVDGVGSAARFEFPFYLAVDGSDNVLVTERDDDMLRRVTPTGVVTTLQGRAFGIGSLLRFTEPAGVAVDARGNIVVVDRTGLIYRTAVIVTSSPASQVVSPGTNVTFTTTAVSDDAITFQWHKNGGPLGGATNSSLVLTSVQAADQGRYSVTYATARTVAQSPEAILTVFEPSFFVTLAGSGVPGSADGSGTAASFNFPLGVTFDAAGNAYVADVSNHVIRKITRTGVVSTFAGQPGTPGSSDGNINDAASTVRFRGPRGLAFHPNGSLFVADTYNHTIRRITPAGVVTTIAGVAGTVGSSNGTGINARFNAPAGIAVDPGNLHLMVSDTNNRTIRRVSPDGSVATIAGQAGVSGTTDGPGASARFGLPNGLAVDAASNIYVADEVNHIIRKVAPGGRVTTLAGSAVTPGSNDGTGADARFNLPSAVAVDARGNVYVADSGNRLIRKISDGAVVTTIAGSLTAGNVDGVGNQARFSSPAGIAVDGAGNLFVSDPGNQNIRRTLSAALLAPIQPGFLNVAVGGSINLSTTATSDLPAGLPTFQWRKNGVAIPGATASTFNIASSQFTDAGNYSVAATNPAGTTISTPVVVTVAAANTPLPPTITTHPQSQSVTAGSSVQFSVAAVPVTGTTFQWARNATAIAGATGATFTINGVTTANAGSYTAVVTNAGLSATSNAATLVVNAATNAAISTQPVSQTVPVGGFVEFEVEATLTAGTTFQWRKNGTAIPGATNASFTIGTAATTDAGTYTVVVTNSGNSVTSDPATLTVSAPPTFTTQPANQTVAVGAPAQFSVSVTPGAGTTFQWAKNGVTLPGATNAVLTLAAATLGDAGTYTVVASNGAASTTSNPATLTVNAPAGFAPVINTQPADVTVTNGTPIILSLSASGTQPLGFQWFKNGTPIPGATGIIFSIGSAQSADDGNYSAVVTNSAGTAASNSAVVRVVVPPSIATQPASQSAVVGSNVQLSVGVAGTAPFRFQWRKAGAVISGATDVALTLNAVQLADAGAYSVTVSNPAGLTNSAAATLAIVPPGPASRLSNLSVRTTLAAGQIVIVGIAVNGGTRDVLVRAVGPGLAPFGLTTAMADPRLELFRGQSLVLANDDWPANLAPIFAGAGAFALPLGSRDAAFRQGLDGGFSIQARGTGPGVVLVEAYDIGIGNTPRLVNVSARNRVGTGDDILIAGFNIEGTGTKQLLIRAVGPGLAGFGVTGTLVDPRLDVFNGAGTRITENDNWAASLAPTFGAVGAFGLTVGSRDAALLTTLPPGSYSVQVRGADGGTGEALVEIYEVP